jgi:DNA-binding FrmR family transcriptional regulator
MSMKADKQAVSLLLRTARGQIDGVLRMVEDDRYCMDIANQILACEAVLRRAHMSVLRAHLEGCVTEAISEGDAQEKIGEMLDVLEKLSR